MSGRGTQAPNFGPPVPGPVEHGEIPTIVGDQDRAAIQRRDDLLFVGRIRVKEISCRENGMTIGS